MLRHTLLLTIFLLSNALAYSQTDASALTQRPGQRQALDSLDNYINTAIEEHYFPGAQLVIGNSSGEVYSKSYGYLDYSKAHSVNDSTLYDLASCTKIFATTLATMTLIDQNKLSLDTKIKDKIEGGDTLKYGDITVDELLHHCTGFNPGVQVSVSLVSASDEDLRLLSARKTATHPYHFDTRLYIAKDITYDSLYINQTGEDGFKQISDHLYLSDKYQIKLDSMVNAAYNPRNHGIYRYSDLNFYILQRIIEKTVGMSLDKYVSTIYDKMKLHDLGFNPRGWSAKDNIAPTEYDVLFRRDTLQGIVHDELACVQGGVCGNAGLFGSANTLAQICGMFLRGGVDYNQTSIVSDQTMKLFTQPKRFRSGSIRGLGFAKLDPDQTPYTLESYGHTGYTGTYFWIDPTQDLYVILLTNRVNPSRLNKQLGSDYRGEMWQKISRINKEYF